jgi:hypothetical protein
MHAAGDEKIACPFRRGLGEDGRFDLQEALLAERLANGEGDVVAQAEVALHLSAAQVNVAVFEADFFVLDGLFSRREGREARVVEDEQLGGFNLDLAGGHLGIDGVFGAQAHLADGGNDILRADGFTLEVAFGCELFIQDNLRDAGAVAEVEEDQVAVVTAAVDPAHEDDVLTGICGSEIAAQMRTLESA